MINEDEFFNNIAEIVKIERKKRKISQLSLALTLGHQSPSYVASPYASEKNDYTSISNEFNGQRYIIVLSKDRNGHWVVSYYSMDK